MHQFVGKSFPHQIGKRLAEQIALPKLLRILLESFHKIPQHFFGLLFRADNRRDLSLDIHADQMQTRRAGSQTNAEFSALPHDFRFLKRQFVKLRRHQPIPRFPNGLQRLRHMVVFLFRRDQFPQQRQQMRVTSNLGAALFRQHLIEQPFLEHHLHTDAAASVVDASNGHIIQILVLPERLREGVGFPDPERSRDRLL